MNNATSTVAVNILINVDNAQANAAFNAQMNAMRNSAQSAAKDSALSWSNIFGANFFADLAASMVRSMVSGFNNLVSEAIRAASKTESAFIGLESLGKNVGLGQNEASDAVKNLDLVKNGLLTVSDAAAATKNLLATGFNLSQSIEIIKRFGDTAAFGRQAALSFGYSIVSATEGIKNQNSILVDNVGVTKNLSVIMKERGFQIQDLSDKTKGAAAREALYQGLLKETSLQLGDSNKLLATTQGQMQRLDAAQTKFISNLGETVTQSTVVKAVLSGVVSLLGVMANNTGATVAFAAALGLVTAAAVASASGVTALTAAQIANAVAGNSVVVALKAVVVAMYAVATRAQVTAGTLIVATGGFAAIAIALAAAGYALYSYLTAQTETVKLSREVIAETTRQRDAAIENVKVIDSLKTSNYSLAESNKVQIGLYQRLSVESQNRVDSAVAVANAADKEAVKVQQLREEYDRLAKSKSSELEANARNITTNLVAKADEANRLQARIDALIKQETEARKREADFKNNPRTSVEEYYDVRLDKTRERTISAAETISKFDNQALIAKKAYTELQNEQGKVIEDGKNLYNQQIAVASSLGKTTDQLTDQTYAFNNQSNQANAAKETIQNFGVTQDILANQTNGATDAIQAQIDALNGLTTVADRASKIQDIKKEVVEKFAAQKDVQGGVKSFNDYLKNNPALQEAVKQTQAASKLNKELDEIISPKEKKEPKRKTELQSLTDSVRKLRGEVQSYQNLSTKEFRLRFEREELERVKRDFEKIIDLRRELGAPINAPLPSNAEAARREIDNLERIKKLRDDVLKIRNEERDAQDKLTLAMLAAGEQVVSAQTRADIAYFEGLRKRRDAEQQLTAEIIGEIRKREQMQRESVQNTQMAQAEAYKELLAEQNQQAEARLKQIARIQLLAGAVFSDNPLLKAAVSGSSAPNPVVTRLDKSNELLQQILDAVNRSGMNYGAGDGMTSQPFGGTGKTRAANSIISVAKRLGVNPVDLAAVISYETAGTFDPWKAGPITKWGQHRGLIQWGYVQRQQYGVTQGMSFEQQMEAVFRYLRDRGVRPGANLLSIYKAVNGGNVNVSNLVSDGYGTQVQHVARIMRDHRRKAMSLFNFDGVQNTNLQTAVVNRPTRNVNRRRTDNLPQAQTNLPTRPRIVTNAALPQLNASGLGLAELDALTQRMFSMNISDPRLSKESLGVIEQYLAAQKRFTDNADGQFAAQDRLNQSLNVNFKQVEEIEIAEARLKRLREGDATASLEALQAGELSRAKQAEQTLQTLIANEAYLAKLRNPDGKTRKALDESFRNEIAQGTITAREQAYKDQKFLRDFNATGERRGQRVRENLDESRRAARLAEIKSLTIEIYNLEQLATAGGRDRELEALRLRKERAAVIASVGEAEAKLEQMRTLNADAEYVRARRNAQVTNYQIDLLQKQIALEDMRDPQVTQARRMNQIGTERTQIETRLLEIQDEFVTSGYNQALREELATQEALLKIRKDDLKAREDIARIQVELQDKTVYHEDQANAKVLEHINSVKSLTQIYADAKIAIVDGVFGGIDKMFAKITGKIPVISKLLQDLLGGITKLIASQFLPALLGIGGGANGGSWFQQLFGGLFGGGLAGGRASTPPFNTNAGGSLFGGFGQGNQGGFNFGNANYFAANNFGLPYQFAGGGFGRQGNGNVPQNFAQILQAFQPTTAGGGGSLLQQLSSGVFSGFSLTRPRIVSTVANATRPRIVGAAANASIFSRLFGGIGFGKTPGTGGALAGMLPLLGGTLGYQAAGGGLLGLIAGGGGALLGVGLTAAPAALAAGGSLSSLGFLAPLFSNPITAIVGAGILIGGIIGGQLLKRNKLRRQEEKQRTQILLDSKSEMQKIIDGLRGGRLDSTSALAQAQQIRADYLNKVGQLKDKKTRNIAIATVRELDAMIETIKKEGRRADYARALDDKLVPTFANGGFGNQSSYFTGYGGYSYGDFMPAVLARNEAVLNPQTIANLGGYDALRRAGVRGMSMNNYDGYSSRPAASYGGGSGGGNFYSVIVADEKTADAFIAKVRPKAVARKVKAAVYTGNDDGLTNTIERRMAGEF